MATEQPVYLACTTNERTTMPPPPQQQQQTQAQASIVHDSSVSIYERVRHFLYINFALNKRSFVLSILSYVIDLTLFVALNLYLFSSKPFLYECSSPIAIVPLFSSNDASANMTLNMTLASTTNRTRTPFSVDDNTTMSTLVVGDNVLDVMSDADASSTVLAMSGKELTAHPLLKQSYLSVQILAILVLFICFVLSYLIKLQFKYHRLALNLYDYDVADPLNSTADRDSLASTTTASHLSNRRKLTSLLKRLLVKLLTKFASILLNFFFGYQFCQNCFVQQGATYSDSFTIFTHVFICACVVIRFGVMVLQKKSSQNKLAQLKKLEQKRAELFDPLNAKRYQQRGYYHYYYSYLIKSSQAAANQLRQHQQNQSTFRVFQLTDLALSIGFSAALFQLFSLGRALELLLLICLPALLTLVLLRFKSLLNATVNLMLLILSLLYLSEQNSPLQGPTPSTRTTLEPSCSNYQGQIVNGNTVVADSTFSLLSINFFTFLVFLLTLYAKSLISIYFCTLTSLERWNLSFLSKSIMWRKVAIFATSGLYAFFMLACTIALCVEYEHWAFLIAPLFLCVAVVWCSFALMNTVNLTYLMNKINDYYGYGGVGNAAELSGLESETNSTRGSIKKSTSSNNPSAHNAFPADSNSHHMRNSVLSQSSNLNGSGRSHSLFSRLKKSMTHLLNHLLSSQQPQPVHSLPPIHRILADKDVRHLASISYRISLYCFTQTLILSVFAYNANSAFVVGAYLCTLSLNFIWISLLYQFCKSITGSCIAFSVVAPPHLLNKSRHTGMMSIDSGGQYTNCSSLLSNPSLYLGASKKMNPVNSLSAGSYLTNGTMATSTTTGVSASLLFLPFHYQQAISQRCGLILRKMQQFCKFHFIENFGNDFAATGLAKEPYVNKMKAFFAKRKTSDEPYDTYLLYYCGPTSSNDHISFIDGNELSIKEIVDLWKETNCVCKTSLRNNIPSSNTDTEASKSANEENGVDRDIEPRQIPAKSSSRLIIILDSENTSKALDYIKSKLIESNIYVAVQTAKYNYTNAYMLEKAKCDPKKKLDNKVQEGPGSPQTIVEGADIYLNFGKFTLDWLKSNYFNAQFNILSSGSDEINYTDTNYYSSYNNRNGEFDEEREQLHIDEVESDQDEDEESEVEDVELAEKQTMNRPANQIRNSSTLRHPQSNKSEVFYEAKCAFSRYWVDFTFNDYEKAMARDFDQFSRIYYPHKACQPLLKLVNCRIFYIKFNLLKRALFYLRRVKTRLIPIHEFDTGHGFKLFSS